MRIALAAALAAMTGCSLLVDVDGVRPHATDAGPGDDADGAAPAFGLHVPDFHLPERGDGPSPVIFEGIGYRYAGFDGENLMPAPEHAPIPVVVSGVSGADIVNVTLPVELPGTIEVCGLPLGPGEMLSLLPLGASELGCGLAGDLAVFTVAIPVFVGWGAQESAAVTITVSGDERPLELRGLDELGIPAEMKPPVAGELWSAAIVTEVVLDANDLSPDGFRLRATSHVEIANATIDASTPPHECGIIGCPDGNPGGPGGARGGDSGEDGEGAGGGEGARCTADAAGDAITGKGGGGGAHGSGAGAGEDGVLTSCVGGGPGESFAPLLLLPFDELAGGAGGGGGGWISTSMSTAWSGVAGGDPQVHGGGGGGGGGVIAIESRGVVRVDAASLRAQGGSGNPGQFAFYYGGGGGGGGAGGTIRILSARAILTGGASLTVNGGAGGPAGGAEGNDAAGAGGAGALGRVRIDGMPGVFPGGSFVRAPDYVIAPPGPIQRVAAPDIAIHPGSLTHDIVIGVRGVDEETFAASPVAGNHNGPLPQPLVPGLNEVCLFLEEEPALSVADALPDARRCVWVAYLP